MSLRACIPHLDRALKNLHPASCLCRYPSKPSDEPKNEAPRTEHHNRSELVQRATVGELGSPSGVPGERRVEELCGNGWNSVGEAGAKGFTSKSQAPAHSEKNSAKWKPKDYTGAVKKSHKKGGGCRRTLTAVVTCIEAASARAMPTRVVS